MNQIEQARSLGQSIWYDNMRRGLLVSGGLKRLIEQGVSGLTSNPTIFERAIAGSTDYDHALSDPTLACRPAKEIYEALILEDIRSAADLLRPVFDRTGGEDGYASLEPNPDLAYDTRATLAEVRRLWAALDRPNVMVKVPGTPEGMLAVRQLTAEGINVNITLVFSLDAYRQVREAYISGLEDRVRKGGDIGKIASVASFFVSRMDTSIDALLEERIRQGREELTPLLGKAAVANSRLAYQAFKTTFASRRFAELRAKGARVQRVLWASTSTKNPAYPDLLYVESLIGQDTINTLPANTVTAFLDHGRVRATVEEDIEGAQRVMRALDAAGISMEEVAGRLLREGVKSFSDSLHKLLDSVEQKKTHLLSRNVANQSAALGHIAGDVTAALADFKRREVTARLWQGDHTVWKPEPKEIADRLGWLSVAGQMLEQVPALKTFAEEARQAGFCHVVLLGMGGSSLGPEVARQIFGSAPGHAELVVLDSTVPARIQAVTKLIDPATTLFLVSSKSGATTEPLAFYRYFRARADRALGRSRAAKHFVAITDPGTPLEQLAGQQKFRRVFLNPSNIGGRYSALSYFGLVPMALIGIDIQTILERAERMCQACASCVPVQGNPGAWLGAVMGSMANGGRDKLTLVASPAIAGFGLWAEQLLAESTGKEGKGIVPVAGEPLVAPRYYGQDRYFVCLRLDGDDNAACDNAVDALRSAGHPVIQLDLRDKYDIAAEFFRWEFAVAVAGSMLGINPFDQPNVQQSKDITMGLLAGYERTGELPGVEAPGTLSSLLDHAAAGNYLAIQAYVCQTPGVDKAFQALRRAVLERYRIATTLGYGPRFLHSTGQLHKGGPNTGLFLQVTSGRRIDLKVPEEPYTFGVLVDAQALGDLRALQSSGRRVVSIDIESGSERAVRELLAGLAEPAS